MSAREISRRTPNSTAQVRIFDCSEPDEVAHTDARWSKFATGWNAGRDELFAFLTPAAMTVVRRPEAAMPGHDGDDTTEHSRVSATLQRHQIADSAPGLGSVLQETSQTV